LGETFDIHGGGIDLVFPHHENEIAQSRCAFRTPVMANYWMHNGFLQVEGRKMAKSEGNFVTIDDQLDHWGPAVLRLNMLKTHYRQPIDWTQVGLKEAGREISRWIELVQPTPNLDQFGEAAVAEALNDDLNTPQAITNLRTLYKEENAAALRAGMNLMGLPTNPESIQGRKHKRLYAETGHFIVSGQPVVLKVNRPDGMVEIDSESRVRNSQLIDARNAARKARHFKEADRIRDELAAMGIVLHDTKDGTTWEIAR
jgi:cysteinyl-tRNA synthetase